MMLFWKGIIQLVYVVCNTIQKSTSCLEVNFLDFFRKTKKPGISCLVTLSSKRDNNSTESKILFLLIEKTIMWDFLKPIKNNTKLRMNHKKVLFASLYHRLKTLIKLMFVEVLFQKCKTKNHKKILRLKSGKTMNKKHFLFHK